MTDPFGSPTNGGEARPAVRELAGRLCIFLVRSADPNARYGDKPRPSVNVDLYILDGGDLIFGSSLASGNERPATHRVTTPCVFNNIPISGTNVFRALYPWTGAQPVVGTVVQSEVGQRPWNVNFAAKGSVDHNRAIAFWNAMVVPSDPAQLPWTPPRPVPLNPMPAPGVAASSPYAPGYTRGALGVPAAAPAHAPAPQPWVPPAGPVAPAHAAPTEFIPPGYEALWAGLNPEQKKLILAAVGQQPAAGPVQPLF